MTYRNDAVDIAVCTDETTNGYKVTSVAPTEWLQYSFQTENNDSYILQLRIAASQPSVLDVFINGQVAVKDFTVDTTGDQWITATINRLELKKGLNRLRIASKSGEFSLNYLKFSKKI